MGPKLSWTNAQLVVWRAVLVSRTGVRQLNRIVGDRRELFGQRQALIELLARSLKFGHRRLAIRRYLMLKICCHSVPFSLEDSCRVLLAAAKPLEINRIEASVNEWHLMLYSVQTLRTKRRLFLVPKN